MTDTTRTILVVDSNPVTRATLARQLASPGRTVLEAGDGTTALQMVQSRNVGLLVTELYLATGDSDCLVQAVRQERVRGLRTLALTSHRTRTDRDWAKQWGAAGFVLQPAASERLSYVVTRLLAQPTRTTTTRTTARRDSLDHALGEIERGELPGTRSIVFGRPWWDALHETQRRAFRNRARKARVTLRSDAKMGPHFVELRGASAKRSAPSPKSPKSPYRA